MADYEASYKSGIYHTQGGNLMVAKPLAEFRMAQGSKFTQKPSTFSGDGAIVPTQSGYVVLTKGSAAAMTIAGCPTHPAP